MDEEVLKRVLVKYRSLIPKDIFSRELEIYNLKTKKANVLVGPRKAGKTYFLYSLMKKYKNPVLINFEDNLLVGLGNQDLNKILEYSKELFGREELSFFFDEIQNITDWERFILSLLNEGYEVYATGSNSKLLSKEIATSLRGKSLSYLILPFSFKEFLKLKNTELTKNFQYSNKIHDIKRYFKEYFTYGGFPEITLNEPLDLKNKIINSYFDSVLYKDLVERLNLKNIKLVEITIKYILNLFGNMFSIVSFENYLKSNKISYSLEDLYNILKSLEDVFFAGYVREFSKSFKKTEVSKSKVYLFDMGYVHFLAKESEDYGRILENLIFIELFRRSAEIENKNIYFFKEQNKECDFLVTSKGQVTHAIQACYNLNFKNKEREIAGLVEALNKFNLKEGLIITFDQEDKMKVEGKTIKLIPAWKWLLE
jgi:predicted AAA+ superfamily ATPase